ncbi:MAG: hypothetical protein IKT98_07385 [Selenomonadaceae bacterium]|nr:hypothetical protein [Selenomonadaceae bacterium]
MRGTLDSVKQTHKAILFEEFNGWQQDSFNLATLLDGTYKDADDMLEIISRLEVHSFKEFVEKFSPKIYENVQQVGGKWSFSYTFDDGKASGVPIKLNEHAYYRMLSAMYGVKKDSGQSNRDFDDSKLKEILTPKAEEKEVQRIRKKAVLLNVQYTEAVNKKENANFYAKQMQSLGREVAQKAYGSSLSKLGLRIAGINSQLDYLRGEAKKFKALPAGSENVEIKRGVLEFDEEGKPIIKELASGILSGENFSSTPRLTAGESMKKLKSGVATAIDAGNKSRGLTVQSFTKNMVLSTYLPDYEEESFSLTPAGISDKCQKLELERKGFEEIYSQAQSEFIKMLKQIVTRMLGVKVFFDHATTKGGEDGVLPQNQGLLVTNCPVSDLLDERIKSKFEKFIVDRGTTQTRNHKLWFGILPHVIIGDINPDEQEDDGDIDPFAINMDFDIKDSTKKTAAVTALGEAKQLLAILEKARILTVFNPAVAEDAPFTFGGITDTAIKEIKDKLKELGIIYEHAVFAFPNFNLVRDAKIPLDKREDAEVIEVSSVYVDAAYVAAGLLVASQQPDYLLHHGFGGRIDAQNVCVRLDLEEEDFVKNLCTHFNLELSSSWQKEIIDALADDRFGFAFSGDGKSVKVENETVDLKNSYIFSARTMFQNENGIYQPIYKTLTNDFIWTYLKTYGAKTTRTIFKEFLREVGRDWQEFTKRAEAKGIINVILRKDESITKSDVKEGTLRVKLGDGETFIDLNLERE